LIPGAASTIDRSGRDNPSPDSPSRERRKPTCI
jgi:hypothetical protein